MQQAWRYHVGHGCSQILKPVQISVVGSLLCKPGAVSTASTVSLPKNMSLLSHQVQYGEMAIVLRTSYITDSFYVLVDRNNHHNVIMVVKSSGIQE